MNNEELHEISRGHKETYDNVYGNICELFSCHLPWPCDTIRLLDHIAEQQAALQELGREAHNYLRYASPPTNKELRKALALPAVVAAMEAHDGID